MKKLIGMHRIAWQAETHHGMSAVRGDSRAGVRSFGYKRDIYVYRRRGDGTNNIAQYLHLAAGQEPGSLYHGTHPMQTLMIRA